MSSFPPDARPPLDPTLQEAKRRQQDALLGAVAGRATTWSEADRSVAAAVLDVLWSVASYERLVVDWQIDRAEATRGMAWMIGLIRQALLRAPVGSHRLRRTSEETSLEWQLPLMRPHHRFPIRMSVSTFVK